MSVVNVVRPMTAMHAATNTSQALTAHRGEIEIIANRQEQD
jgi:hypothetical protein